jgi:L-alanine-DL-glutamate epimerase-like enolase superfamily enzyme
MRIKSVESTIVALPFDMGGPKPAFAGRPWDHLEILMVRVETEDGMVGWGEAFGHAAIPATRAALDSIVAPLVIGRDADDIEALSRSILHAVHLLGRNGPFVYAYSGIEIALWDIRGKRAGKPLHALLGDKGRGRTELDAYASLLWYADKDVVARNTAAACARGYRYIKLHQVTRDDVLAAKAAPGADTARIMLDVNCAWSVDEAHAMAQSLKGDDLLWLEEPVYPPEDSHGLAAIRKDGIAIAAGENTAGVFGFQALIDAGAIDIAQPSVTKIGGIGEVLRVIALGHARGVQVTPHCPYFGAGFLASVHIIAALIDKPLVEVLWLDMEANPFDPWVKPVNGRVKVPQGPGLGCDPDPAIVARYRVGETVVTAQGRT